MINKMSDFSISLPGEISSELGARARTRRIALNLSVDELAARMGVSAKTLGNFERSGRCTLETFILLLEALNATADLQIVLAPQIRTIDDMRSKAAVSLRKRAYRKTVKLQNQKTGEVIK